MSEPPPTPAADAPPSASPSESSAPEAPEVSAWALMGASLLGLVMGAMLGGAALGAVGATWASESTHRGPAATAAASARVAAPGTVPASTPSALAAAPAFAPSDGAASAPVVDPAAAPPVVAMLGADAAAPTAEGAADETQPAQDWEDEAPSPAPAAPAVHTAHDDGRSQRVAVPSGPAGPLRITSAGVVAGYQDGHRIQVAITMVGDKPVERRTAEAFRRMQSAALRAGVHIAIVSGFRTMEHQRQLFALYRAGRGNLAAVPGHSNHQSGHALDLNVTAPGVRAWLEAHGREFGFRRTVPTESWHWEFW